MKIFAEEGTPSLQKKLSARRVTVEEGYRLWAPKYEREPNPLHALEERHLKALLPDLSGKDVLDIACGTGRWLERLLTWGARSGRGVDFCADMLAEAAAKPPLQGHLVRGDCLALPFPAGIANLIICTFAIYHFRDLQGLGRELARVARNHTDLFVTDFHPLGYEHGWRRTFHHAEETIEVASRPYSIQQICGAFSSGGFALTECHEPYLGPPEKPIFEERGKSHLFDSACQFPAIFICHFKLARTPAVQEV